MSKRISEAFAVTENNVYLTLFEKGTALAVEGVEENRKAVE